MFLKPNKISVQNLIKAASAPPEITAGQQLKLAPATLP
jgi:hypothetical protein